MEFLFLMLLRKHHLQEGLISWFFPALCLYPILFSQRVMIVDKDRDIQWTYYIMSNSTDSKENQLASVLMETLYPRKVIIIIKISR